MFFTNVNPEKKYIMKATMGGAEGTQLFSAESPGDLALDKEGKKLFWTDTELKKIEYGGLTGNNSYLLYIRSFGFLLLNKSEAVFGVQN